MNPTSVCSDVAQVKNRYEDGDSYERWYKDTDGIGDFNRLYIMSEDMQLLFEYIAELEAASTQCGLPDCETHRL
jgi:hypothetical protein